MPTKAKRKIKQANISLISLVPRGANRVVGLFKDEDHVEFTAMAKMDSQGLLTALVYVPNAVDSQGDVATAEVIKDMAHNFIANMDGNGIDVMHDCQPVGNDRAQVCESFIVQKGDPRFAGVKNDDGEEFDPTHSWGTVIKIHDPVLKAPYESGEWVGVSMFGSALVEPVTKHQDPNPTTDQEIEMDEKKFAEMLKEFGTGLATNIVEGLSKAMKPAKPEGDEGKQKVEKTETEIEFEGDPTNAEDLAKHADKVMLANCNMGTPEGIAKWQDYLAKKEAAKGEPTEIDKQVAELEKQIAKLRKGSNAEGEVKKEGGETLQDKLAKSQERAKELKKSGVIR